MASCKDCIHCDLCKDMHIFGITDLPYDCNGAICDHFKNKADVVEVVRCKDCKRCYINSFGKEANVGICNQRGVIGTTVQLDDFCNYGERKEPND